MGETDETDFQDLQVLPEIKVHDLSVPGERFLQGQNRNDSFYMLVTLNDVRNKRYGHRVRLYQPLSAGTSISFDAGNMDFKRLMKITLVEPLVLSETARYVATVTISHRNSVNVTTDMDPIVTVSDGQFVLGYQFVDQGDSPKFMYAAEGRSGHTFEDYVYPFLVTSK